jgi:hypothetical protein
MWFNLVALLYIQIFLLVYDKLPIYTIDMKLRKKKNKINRSFMLAWSFCWNRYTSYDRLELYMFLKSKSIFQLASLYIFIYLMRVMSIQQYKLWIHIHLLYTIVVCYLVVASHLRSPLIICAKLVIFLCSLWRVMVNTISSNFLAWDVVFQSCSFYVKLHL